MRLQMAYLFFARFPDAFVGSRQALLVG